MAVDPLSPATRGAKRNLLVSSVLSITFKGFDVHIDKIPVGPLAIDFNDRLFTFLLLLCTLYFLLSFALYFFIDIRNIDRTSHQNTSDELLQNRMGGFYMRTESALEKKLTDAAEDCRVVFDLMGNPGAKIKEALRTKQIPSFSIRGRTHSGVGVSKEIERREISQATALLEAIWPSVKLKFRLVLFRQNLRWYSVAAAYSIRNYFVDGVLPIILGFTAIAALYGLIGVRWLQAIAP